MTRSKKNILLIGLIFLILFVLGGGLVVLLHHEPGFYRRNVVADGPERKDLSMGFFGQFTKLAANFNEPESPEAQTVIFSEAQINSFLAEDFMRLGDGASLKKLGITDPRVSLEKDRLRVAFRGTNALMSTVFSIDMRVWLVPAETNVIALEILNHKVGALPFFMQSLREEISALASKRNIKVSWYRHDRHPVALVRVQSKDKDRARPNAKLQHLELAPGTLTIGLISLEVLPPTAQANKLLASVGN